MCVREIVIENYELDISNIKQSLLARVEINFYKLLLILASLIYVIIGSYLCPTILFTKKSYVYVLNIVVNLIYYSVYAYITIFRNKQIKKIFTQITEQRIEKCQYIIFDTQIETSNLNVKHLLLQTVSFNNRYLHSIGTIFLAQFIGYMLIMHDQKYDNSLITLTLLIYFGQIVYIAIAFIIFIAYIIKTFIINLMRKSNQKYIYPAKDIIVNIDQECSICLSPFKDQQSMSTYFCCNNSFHTSCIQTWSQQNRTCPLCRSKIY